MYNLHHFPGSNTPLGFHSYFNYILPENAIKKSIILKGGPGCGKSTLMKQVGVLLEKQGVNCTYMHCSSDPDSLDAICAPELGFVMLDGTAPHITDPALPGCRDELLPLGMYWDDQKISNHKNEIADINLQIKHAFSSAYEYLHAAQCVQNCIRKACQSDPAWDAIEESVQKTIELLPKAPTMNNKAIIQKCFAEAFTPNGYVSYIHTYANASSHIIHIDAPAHTVSGVLTALTASLTKIYPDICLFYDPMYPDKNLLHIYLPSVKTLITGSKPTVESKTIQTVLLRAEIRTPMRSDTDLYNLLLSKAISHLKHAKSLHDDLEQFYVPYMDFDAMSDLPKNILKCLI